jgi:hypothetical protein
LELEVHDINLWMVIPSAYYPVNNFFEVNRLEAFINFAAFDQSIFKKSA